MIDKIICGDSIELIKSIDNEYVHAIISDIPYGICYEDWDILHNNSNSALGGTSNAQLEMGSLFKRRGKPRLFCFLQNVKLFIKILKNYRLLM